LLEQARTGHWVRGAEASLREWPGNVAWLGSGELVGMEAGWWGLADYRGVWRAGRGLGGRGQGVLLMLSLSM